MPNQWMRREIKRGELIDVSRCKRTKAGDYILPKRLVPPQRTEPKDYANVETEGWIWSIGRRGDLVVASETARFYRRRGWECIWLR